MVKGAVGGGVVSSPHRYENKGAACGWFALIRVLSSAVTGQRKHPSMIGKGIPRTLEDINQAKALTRCLTTEEQHH